MQASKNLYIVSDFPQSSDTLRYVSVAQELGYDAVQITHDDRLHISAGDAVVLRGSPKRSAEVLKTLEHIESVGAVCLTTTTGWAASKDRYLMYTLLESNGTASPFTTKTVDDFLAKSRVPAVIKISNSNQGNGVAIADTNRSLISFTDTLDTIGREYVLQEYIASDAVEDYRYFVVGGQVAAAMKRSAQSGEFRSNLSLGGSAIGVVIDDEMAKLAVRAAASMQLGLAGVDIMVSENGPTVLEVNASPGLGIEDVTNINVAITVVKEVVSRWQS